MFIAQVVYRLNAYRKVFEARRLTKPEAWTAIGHAIIIIQRMGGEVEQTSVALDKGTELDAHLVSIAKGCGQLDYREGRGATQ